MSETGPTPLNDDFARSMVERVKKMTEGVERMPYIASEHLVDLSRFVTVDDVPLTTEDLDTAIEIVNRHSHSRSELIVRGRSIELNTMTLHRTSAGPMGDFDVNGVLHYLARRPSAPKS